MSDKHNMSNNRRTDNPLDKISGTNSQRDSVNKLYSRGNARLKEMMNNQFASVNNEPNYTVLQSKSASNERLLEERKKKYAEEHKQAVKQKLSAKEAKEKAMQARDTKTWLKQDASMLFDKFFVIKTADGLVEKWRAKSNIANDITGIYIIGNVDNRMFYIGRSTKAFDACWQIFRSKEDSKNYVANVKNDFDNGDKMVVNFVKLKDTSFDTLEELEAFYIDKYNSIQDGYNSKLGAKPKRHWYAYM